MGENPLFVPAKKPMKNLSLFAVMFALVGCGGSDSSPSAPPVASIADYATWNLTVSSASAGVDTSPITTSNYRCSSFLEQGAGSINQIRFVAYFTRTNGRTREFNVNAFLPETLVVGEEVTFGTGGGIQGIVRDWRADTGPERDAAYDAVSGGVRVIAVEGGVATFELNATFRDLAGSSFNIAGTYSYNYARRAEFVSFNPCPARP
jgi:hypothetical protein